MLGLPSSLPPIPAPADVLARIELLEPHANDNIPGQHLVSKSLLARFTEPWGKNQASQLARLTLARASHPPRWGGPARFGKMPNFVRFASRLVEQVWQETETKLHAAFAALDDGTIFNNTAHIETIRDVVILHFVRSIPALHLHNQVWKNIQEVHRRRWLQYPQALSQIHYHLFGYYPAGREGYVRAADALIDKVHDYSNRGAILRVSLEDRFRRLRIGLRDYGVEIFVAKDGEFLIGDAPALTIQHGQERAGLGEIGLGPVSKSVRAIR